MKKKNCFHESETTGLRTSSSMHLTDSSAAEDREIAHPFAAGCVLERSTPDLLKLKLEEIKRIGSYLPEGSPPSPPGAGFSNVLSASDHCELSSMCDSGRPSSMSSWASSMSSRTSRSSDYFPATCSSEAHLSLLPSSGLPQLNYPIDTPLTRYAAQSRVDAVDEEDEEELKTCTGSDVTLSRIEDQTNADCDLKLSKSPTTCNNTKQEKVVSVKDINKKLSEVDLRSPIASGAMLANPELSYVDRIILELLETERMYVRALEDILGGYILAMKNRKKELPISAGDLETLFANIKDIYAFNRKFLALLENSRSDPVEVANCFISKGINFGIYTHYCTNYPQSVCLLTRFMKNQTMTEFLKNQQSKLQHSLPLGSYLLKPVQRILKYHLILQEMLKSCDKALEGYHLIERALATMTQIAHHINNMKRKHEDTVRLQEIQSLLVNYEGDDLMTCGELVKEGDMKLHGAKGERRVFLFDKLIMITKLREDGFFFCKCVIECSDLMLQESVADDSLSFTVLGFSDYSHNHLNVSSKTNGKLQHRLTAKSIDDKESWTYEIKRLILKHHHRSIPLKAQQSILNSKPMTYKTERKKVPRFGKGSQSHEEGKHKHPLTRLGSTVSASVINIQEKVRKRSDSSKSPAARGNHSNESAGEEKVSFSVPSTPSIAVDGSSRFSFPTLPSNVDVTRVTNNLYSRAEAENGCVENDGAELDKECNGREIKAAVVYRRHKRRTSQPITFTERRESAVLPDVPDPPESSDDNGDELLSFRLGCRESVSWDVQIVEAVFNRFKKSTPVTSHVQSHSADVRSATEAATSSQVTHNDNGPKYDNHHLATSHSSSQLHDLAVRRDHDQYEGAPSHACNHERPKSFSSCPPPSIATEDKSIAENRPVSVVSVNKLESGNASVVLLPRHKNVCDKATSSTETLTVTKDDDDDEDKDDREDDDDDDDDDNNALATNSDEAATEDTRPVVVDTNCDDSTFESQNIIETSRRTTNICDESKTGARLRYLERVKRMRGRYPSNPGLYKDTQAIPNGIVRGLLTKHDAAFQHSSVKRSSSVRKAGRYRPNVTLQRNDSEKHYQSRPRSFNCSDSSDQKLLGVLPSSLVPATFGGNGVGLNKTNVAQRRVSALVSQITTSDNEQLDQNAVDRSINGADGDDDAAGKLCRQRCGQTEDPCLRNSGVKSNAYHSTDERRHVTGQHSQERTQPIQRFEKTERIGRAVERDGRICSSRAKSLQRRPDSSMRAYSSHGTSANNTIVTSTKVKELTQKFDRLSKKNA